MTAPGPVCCKCDAPATGPGGTCPACGTIGKFHWHGRLQQTQPQPGGSWGYDGVRFVDVGDEPVSDAWNDATGHEVVAEIGMVRLCDCGVCLHWPPGLDASSLAVVLAAPANAKARTECPLTRREGRI